METKNARMSNIRIKEDVQKCLDLIFKDAYKMREHSPRIEVKKITKRKNLEFGEILIVDCGTEMDDGDPKFYFKKLEDRKYGQLFKSGRKFHLFDSYIYTI